MNLSELHLRHFRNYEQVQLHFPHRLNILIGDNAQGKTNLLESIYLLALGKSHRTHWDRELIRWGEEEALVEAQVNRQTAHHRLAVRIHSKGKQVRINGVEQRRLSDLVGYLNAVLFAPEDLMIVKGSPGLRRRFLDMEIGQVSPVYLHHLNRYQQLLQQRNALLREGPGTGKDLSALLEIWDEQLADVGVKIYHKRLDFVMKLQNWAQQIHAQVTQEKEKLEILYHMSIPCTAEGHLPDVELYLRRLREVREKEMRRGSTLVGPHRDDLSFLVNGKNVQVYGSQGQQRTTALSIKLAEIELIAAEVGEYPVLLLDDVLSELDSERQTYLLSTMARQVQTFLTTTGLDGIQKHVLDEAVLYTVKSGTVRREE